MAKRLAHQAQKLTGKNWSKGSLTIKKNRAMIRLFADRVERKYGLQRIQDLKTKHVIGVFEDLLATGYTASTLSAYATAARTIAKAVGKQNIVPRTNQELGFSRKENRYRPIKANEEFLHEVGKQLYGRSEWQGLAHDLRHHFGLRAKESLLSSEVVIGRDCTLLIVRGAKGGRPRGVPIETDRQLALVDRLHTYLARGKQQSLVPPELGFQCAYNKQRNDLHRLGAVKAVSAHAHSLRHKFVQDLQAAGVSDTDLVEIIGHGRTKSLDHYVSS